MRYIEFYHCSSLINNFAVNWFASLGACEIVLDRRVSQPRAVANKFSRIIISIHAVRTACIELKWPTGRCSFFTSILFISFFSSRVFFKAFSFYFFFKLKLFWLSCVFRAVCLLKWRANKFRKTQGYISFSGTGLHTPGLYVQYFYFMHGTSEAPNWTQFLTNEL